MKLSIGKKIGFSYAAFLIAVLIIAAVSLFSLQSAKEDLDTIKLGSTRFGLSSDITILFSRAVMDARGYIAYGNENMAKQTEDNLNISLQKVNELYSMAAEENRPAIKKLMAALENYKDGVINQLFPAVRTMFREQAAGNSDAARLHKQQVDKIAGGLVPYTQEINKTTGELAEFNKTIVNDRLTTAAQSANQVMMVAGIISLIALVGGILLSYFMTRAIRLPIVAMLTGTQKYANGDLRDIINISSTDELGELANALNTMRENMRVMIREISNSSQQVAASSEELTANAEQSAQVTTQVAASISEVASGTETQVNAIETTSTIVTQMSTGIQQVALSANSVSSMADRMTGAANKGNEAVDAAISQMKSIEKTVSGSSQVVTTLGERSKEIGQIVDAIAGIAGQTNLLALNAAIEAARAGEQGKGFAVVAEEVRKLAEQSQEAAKQIATLIFEIQSQTDNAVVAMNDGTREVKVGAEVVNTAGQAFKEIVSIISDVSSQIKEMSAAIQQMASGSQQIVASVQEIDRISKDTASQTQTVSAATEEQSASMEEIAASSQALAKMAEELQDAIRRFKF